MEKKKIAVIGANQCALVFAKMACEKGFDVTLYEEKKKEDVAYNWTDDMAEETFEQIDFPHPPETVYTRKRSWTFVPPNKKSSIFVEVPENELDLAMYRRPFNNWLEGLALTAGAKVFYSVKVEKLEVKNNKCVGIYLEGQNEYIPYDFILDCAGAMSCVRSTLPDSLGIPQQIRPDEMFFVRRTFFNRPENTKRPEFTNKAYLKHKNEKGISWCLLSYDEKEADVLIGRVGELNDSTYSVALEDLREDNDIIGDTICNGGQLLKIPVRHPIRRMFADGYALLGDSAFMTIPMLGSGMASGMRAAKMLCDVISNPIGDAFSNENLYRYQYNFMRSIGAKHSAIDLMKNWLLNSKDGEVDFLLNNHVINNKVLKQCSAGEMVKMSFGELISASDKGVENPILLLKLCGLLIKMNIQYSKAKKMPKEFNDEEFLKWQLNYEKKLP